MRIRGAKTELEEAGLETDGMVESTAKLREEIMALSGVDIMLDKNTFKSTYQILDELSVKWEDLSDIAQASITELIAGKHQGNVISSLMSNFDIAREALETSLNSSGSAMKEHEKWSQSLEAKLLKLKATWQSLSQTFMNSKFLKVALDAIIKIVNVIDELISSIGTVPTLLGTFAIGKTVSGLLTLGGDIKSFSNLLTALGMIFPSVADGVGIFTAALKGGAKGLGLLKAAGSGLLSVIAAHPILAVAAAVGVAIVAYDKWTESAKELAERIETVTSEYKEQHSSLMKLKGSYDTSNEDSMISKYARLSKGVNALGENVSLTADEYSEYQGIVNTIAEQIPSLVTGYNSQGDAILSCAGNVDVLAESYKNLIREQNNTILDNGEDIFKDFKNDLKNTSAYYMTEEKKENGKPTQVRRYDTKHLEQLKNLMNLNGQELEDAIDELSYEEIERLSKLFGEQGEERNVLGKGDKGWETYKEHVIRILNKDKSEIKSILDGSTSDLNAYAEEMALVTQAYFSDAFLGDYSDMSDRMQNVINQVTSGLDSDFYIGFLNEEDPMAALEEYYNNMMVAFDSLSNEDTATFEAAFDLQTQFNGGEISYGEYVNGIRDVAGIIDSMGLKPEIVNQIKLSLNADEITDNYEALKERLTSDKYNIQMETKEAEEFLNGLSASEYAVAVDLMMSGEVDLSDFDIESLRKYIEEEAKLQDALNFTIAIDFEAESLEALNAAMAESVSATGLSSTSIAALKDRYAELASQGYDLSSMFEETSHGIHINREAVDELERAYASDKLSETKDNLDVLKKRYDELTVEINNCSDASERASLYREQQTIVQKINDLGTLAAQYEGLTSAYNDWLSAEESGSERDMYERIIEGFETVGDEIKRGWYDDGTIKFLELMTGQTDLASRSASQLKEIWKGLDDNIKNTSYSVKDFFTVDEDGNSTSTGVYNFLRALQELESSDTVSSVLKKQFKDIEGIEDLVTVKDGKITAFNFDVVGGEEAIAEALGISEELVQIMLRAADDAGFVVTIDGKWTQFADLQQQAEQANDSLKKLSQTNEDLKKAGFGEYDFDFGSSNIETLEEELKKAKELLSNDAFKGADGKFNINAEGAKDALKIAETLQIAKSKLEEPVYMSIDTSELQEDLQEPVKLLQEFEKYSQEKDLLNLTGTDTERLNEIDAELDKIVSSLSEIDEETKIKLGIDGKTPEQIREELENGTIEIPTELTIEANMDKSLEDLVTLGLLEQGLITEAEAKIRLGLEVEEIDTSEIEKALDETDLKEDQKVNILAIAEVIGAEDVETLTKRLDGLTDEQVQVLAKVLGKINVENLKSVMNSLTDEEVQAIAKAIGEGDVTALKDAVNALDPAYVEAIAKAFGLDGVEELNTAIDSMDDKTVKAIADALGIKDVDSLRNAVNRLSNKNVTVAAKTSGKGDVDNLRKAINNLKGKTVTIWAKIKKAASDLWNWVTGGGVDGTAHVDGTANVDGTAFSNGTVNKKFGRAFKQGDWGTRDSGVALGAELGPELLVRNGKWHLIGEDGAQFFGYRKGDIIFNADQTREIFEKGKITHGNGRGKALVSGTAFSGGSGGGEEPEVKSVVVGTNTVTGEKYKKSTDDAKDEFEETFDWIETAIDRIERAINQLDTKASSVYRSWSERNSNLIDEISKVQEEITLQEQAYDKYMSAANAVGLSSDWAEKAKNGAIDISTISDETLAEKISDFQDYYNKALDCQDAIVDLQEKEKELYQQRFDNVVTQYEGMLSIIEHEKNMLDEYIAQSEAQAHLISENYYKALISNEKDMISKLQAEKSALLSELSTQERGTEQWYENVAAIDEVTLAIEQSNTAILEWQQSIQQLKWEQFDLLQERISAITEEVDFLIELLSNDKLFDDDGKLTNEGSATMGLHGVNYNTYMHMADDARKEAERLKKELAKDPYDTELEARYREMIALQQEHILAAEGEKEAIRDLVEEGIETQLDSLQELIDKKNELLDSERDLYEYQKKVKEQTSEIAALEKELGAYENDDSEEAQAKIQQIKVDLEAARQDLEETETDRLIESTAALLDNLYLEYEEILNTRLDNLDALIADVIAQINADASSISATLSQAATDVGYNLSTEMSNIWSTNTGNITSVITTYGNNFSSAQTTTNTVLGNIKTDLSTMIGQLNKIANTNAKSASKSSAGSGSSNTSKNPAANNKNNNNGNSDKGDAGSSGEIKVGGKINAGSAKIYDYAGDTSGERQLYRNDPIYTVLSEKNGYILTRWHKLSSGYTGWFKKSDVKAYATGAKKIGSDDVAWTQEDGQEFIVRPSDGAILTPVAKDDSILKAQASRNIWNMANSPAEFIKNNLSIDSGNIPNNPVSQNSVSQNFENITFSLPNIRNYNELLSDLQKDPKFDKLIKAMTLDQAVGKSKLAKGKAIR